MPSLDDTLGVVFLSLIFVSVLYGVSNVQAFFYFLHAKKDSCPLRWTIFFLWILDTLHFVLLLYRLYDLTVVGVDGGPPGLPSYFGLVTVWPMVAWCFISDTSDFVVRMVFALRVWILSAKNKVLAVSFAFINLFTLVIALAFPIDTLHQLDAANQAIAAGRDPKVPKYSWLLLTHLATVVLSDGFVTTALCVLLWRARTGVKGTDSVLRVLMLYGINTGLVTSLFATIGFIMFLVQPDASIYMFFFVAIPKLYYCALLANLNARERFRKGASAPLTLSQLDKDGTSDQSYRDTTLESNPIQMKRLRKYSM